MQETKLIDQRELFGKTFRVYGDLENPLFIARDVAEWIEYNKDSRGQYNVSQMLETVDDDEKVKIFSKVTGVTKTHTPAKSRAVATTRWFLTEDGLYEVLFQSEKPIAKKFKKEVKKILKELRLRNLKPRTISLDEWKEIITNPDFMIMMGTNMKNEQEKNRALEAKIEQDKPLVDFATAVLEADDTIFIGGLAKILCQNGVDIGEKRLFRWMRENGYLMAQKVDGFDNMPTQYSMNLKLFEVNQYTYSDTYGNKRIGMTTKVTGRGQVYFINKFKAEAEAQASAEQRAQLQLVQQ